MIPGLLRILSVSFYIVILIGENLYVGPVSKVLIYAGLVDIVVVSFVICLFYFLWHLCSSTCRNGLCNLR
nr:hypothetical protein CFP56_39714 [Quercus suber]